MLTKSVPFTFNRSGYFYFTRRVPSDLIHHYRYPRIVQGLRTSSPNVARSRALVAAAKLDEYWSHLRMTDPDLIGKHLLKSMFVPNSVAVLPNVEAADSLSLAQALDSYLLQRGSNKGKTFHAAGRRACSYLVEACGSKQLHEYSRTDALKFREWMVAKGLAGSSITRVLNSLTAIINFAITEYALDIRNSFVGMHIDRRAGVHTRLPIPVSNIQMVQRECKAKDDDVRWLIALMSDTGMRLAEAAGLHRDDIKLDCDIPFVRVQEHSWRRLKTRSSNRNIPLVGASLWAAQRILEDSSGGFAFPRYNKTELTNANSASAALNKWLKEYVPVGCTMHSFRHSMRDRLRAVECPSDIVDQIGGWSTESVGQGYGSGYTLEVLQRWMKSIEVSTQAMPKARQL